MATRRHNDPRRCAEACLHAAQAMMRPRPVEEDRRA